MSRGNMSKKILFVSGVARSGTSALVNVLNTNPGLLVGMERYFWPIQGNLIMPSHFEKERFITVEPGDTHGAAGFALNLEDRGRAYDHAVYVGDKFPLLYNHFDHIFANFPTASHIYILRNPLSVVESYDARKNDPDDNWVKAGIDGLKEWNTSVAKAAKLTEEQKANFHFVLYEDFFSHEENINALFVKLGLPPVATEKLNQFVAKFNEINARPVPRRDDLRRYVARHADFDSYRLLCDRIDAGN